MEWRGQTVRTSIFKTPASGRVRIAGHNLDGDEQSDLAVHGGADKAVYAYPSEHYAYWRGQLAGMDLPWGMFGENLTTEGLLEDAVRIGDRLRVGSADLVVTQPRMPCFKLGLRFGRADMVKRFYREGRTGFYFAVAREGDVEAGDPIEILSHDPGGMSIADIVALYKADEPDPALLRRAVNLSALSASWRADFRRRLERLAG
jgi:MOSC domain-containing protein YiiM